MTKSWPTISPPISGQIGHRLACLAFSIKSAFMHRALMSISFREETDALMQALPARKYTPSASALPPLSLYQHQRPREQSKPCTWASPVRIKSGKSTKHRPMAKRTSMFQCPVCAACPISSRLPAIRAAFGKPPLTPKIGSSPPNIVAKRATFGLNNMLPTDFM